MSPTFISIVALLVSISSFLFTLWGRRQATKVGVAEKLTQAKLAITDVIVTVENLLLSHIAELKIPDSPLRRERFDIILEKSKRIRTKLETTNWPANSDSLVTLEDISGSILEVFKETESLISLMRRTIEVEKKDT